jgi:hypothetical protein
MRAGDDVEDAEADADADEDTDEDTDADDVDDSEGGLESARVAMDGEGADKAVDGFAALVADANEIGSADAAVRLAPLCEGDCTDEDNDKDEDDDDKDDEVSANRGDPPSLPCVVVVGVVVVISPHISCSCGGVSFAATATNVCSNTPYSVRGRPDVQIQKE